MAPVAKGNALKSVEPVHILLQTCCLCQVARRRGLLGHHAGPATDRDAYAAARSASTRSKISARISLSLSGLVGESGWLLSVGIQPRSCKNWAALCLYAGVGLRNANSPR